MRTSRVGASLLMLFLPMAARAGAMPSVLTPLFTFPETSVLGVNATVHFVVVDLHGAATETDQLKLTLTGPAVFGAATFNNAQQDDDERTGATRADGTAAAVVVFTGAGDVKLCATTTIEACETTRVRVATGVVPTAAQTSAMVLTEVPVSFQVTDVLGEPVPTAVTFDTEHSPTECSVTLSATSDANGLANGTFTCPNPGYSMLCARLPAGADHCTAVTFIAAGATPDSPKLSLSRVQIPEGGVQLGAEVRVGVALTGLPTHTDVGVQLALEGLESASLCPTGGSACLMATDAGYALGTDHASSADFTLKAYAMGKVGSQAQVEAGLQVANATVAQDSIRFAIKPLGANLGCTTMPGSTDWAFEALWVSLLAVRLKTGRRRAG